MRTEIQLIFKTHENRICETKGCTNLGRNNGKNKDGTIKRANICEMHFGIKYQKNGWQYKVFRKNYCENIDGRLGFTCTTTITDLVPIECQLHADHIDGDPSNNVEENIQTFCPSCHTVKTHLNKDYLSPGRKALGVL
jgi:5-methylcytosine-specific restriction endonuclease McrA